MKPATKTILKSLDKAYKVQTISRNEIETFKKNYIQLIERVEESETNNESEENFKNHLMDFLKNTYFQKSNLVAPKGKTDFVIHKSNEGSSPASILFEVKRPKNVSEMVSKNNLNCKAMHELMLYYLEERSKHQNNDITHLVITNIYEWYIFDANTFERLFYKNSKLKKDFTEWKEGRKVSRNNDLFYKEIAQPALKDLNEEIECTYFDMSTFENVIRNKDLTDDKKIIELYKILSPTHLLKLQASTDANKLNNKFYSELLHIIGLEEVKEGGKKLIQRKEKGNRNEGSLLENCITIIENEERLHHVADLISYGNGKDEQYFNIGLELCITWINRILFLKLLEAQLQKYHHNNPKYRFLNSQTIKDYDVLNKLFFQVLAKPIKERSESIQTQFSLIPYLNSSLFDISTLESDTVRINSLDDSLDLPLYKSSILFSNNTYKNRKQLNTLEYLFAFLDAYDFASENQEEIVEENRELISASVLGLIFEKINGYRDGSFYTPAFITEYMCRETITKAVIQKFNEVKGWNCATITDLHNKIDDLAEANEIFNSLHICDPAVGSGHFLVSALNVLIHLKSELGILIDRNKKRLRGYHVEVVNDELLVYDEDEQVFSYHVLENGKVNTDIQRVQETLFHEKQTLIENSLFGVDINPNSVKICRLRLWIELLKNAYYTTESNFAELETLPNIDINIKQGNSLLSRYKLDEDLTEVFQKQRFSLQTYRDAVQAYKDSKSKEAKNDLLRFIAEIKEQFKQTVSNRDPKRKQLSELRGKRALLDMNVDMFGNKKFSNKDLKEQKTKLETAIDKLENQISDIEENRLYKGSFEWRFEFPEVLDDKGNFVGFDVAIGNPPYVFARENFTDDLKNYFSKNYYVSQYQINLYLLFIERAIQIMKPNAEFSFIIPNSLLMVSSATSTRRFILENCIINEIVNFIGVSFEGVGVETIILNLSKGKSRTDENIKIYISETNQIEHSHDKKQKDFFENQDFQFNVFANDISQDLVNKLKKGSDIFENVLMIKAGLQAYEVGKGNPKQTAEDVKNRPYDYKFKVDENTFKYLEGKDVGRYFLNWSGSFLQYGNHLASPRTFDLFTDETIIIREITSNHPKSINATFTDEIYLFNRSNIAIKKKSDSRIDLKFALSLLNSKLLSYYFIKNTAKSVRQLFPKLILEDLRKFPIKNIPKTQQLPFIEKVDRILALKKEDPNTDTSQLEAEIDVMVYELYELTPEEIAIVEGKM